MVISYIFAYFLTMYFKYMYIVQLAVLATLLTTAPESQNISTTGEATFVCSAEGHVIDSLTWKNSSTSLLLGTNSSLGITVNVTGDSSSSQRTSVLRIEGRLEYNETHVQCVIEGSTAPSVSVSVTSDEATLLVQGKHRLWSGPQTL